MSEHQASKNPKEHILYVKGMHCSSCEILIEKKLLKKEQITAADVSLSNRTAKVYVERGKFIDIEDLNRIFESDGYVFAKKPFLDQEPPLFSFEDGQLNISRTKLMALLKAGAILVSFLALFFVLEQQQFGKYVSVDASSALPAFFLLGLIAGVSSCAALIGGVLLSLIKHWNELYLGEDDPAPRKTPHVLFHAGRLISFFFFGGILGLIGDTVSLNNTTVYATLVLAVSFMMLILALQMLGIGWAQKFKFRLPKALTRLAADEQRFSGKQMPFFTGVFTFFLPCGFTLIAQGVALTTGSFFQGGLIMLAFALGTLPMLAGISMTGLTFTKRPHLTAKFSQVAGMLVLFFALYNINGQLNVLGFPSLSDLRAALAESETPVSEALAPNPGEQQIVEVIAQGFEYRAAGPTLFQAGVPTKLVVDNQGVLGCGAFIAARGLFSDFVALRKGVNEIDLGMPARGTYKLTCSMGMVPPLTIQFQ